MKTLLRILGQVIRYPGSAMLVFLLAAAGTLLVLVVPGSTQRIIDHAISGQDADAIIAPAALGRVALALRQILFTLRTIFNNAFEQRLADGLRTDVYAKLQRLPIGWFDSRQTGDVLSRVSGDVPSMQRVIVEGIDQGMTAVLQIIAVLAYLSFTEPKLAALMIVPIPIVFGATWWYSRIANPRATEASVAAGNLQAILGDHLGGIRQIKAFAIEPAKYAIFRAASGRLRDASMAMVKLNALVWPGVAFATEAWMVVTIACGAYWIIQGTMTLGTLTAALMLWGLLYEPVGRLPPLAQMAAGGVAAGRRVFEILDEADEADLDTGSELGNVTGVIRFDHVDFGYQPDVMVLQDLSFEIGAGQTLALVGPTGGGKTTVFNLLTRFYEPTRGEVTLDGVSLNTLSKRSLRESIGYVTQEAFLFDTSIAANLRLAKPDATDDELWQALETAEADDFVRAMPDGLQSRTGERGGRLSGGQRQRLSIARVLLKNPPILLLDEATSAIDNTTERQIQTALTRLRANRTTLVIAHRLSTVRDADQICVLEQGRVSESGTHEELVCRAGTYASLVETLQEAD